MTDASECFASEAISADGQEILKLLQLRSAEAFAKYSKIIFLWKVSDEAALRIVHIPRYHAHYQ
jgi:hypothetical protein